MRKDGRFWLYAAVSALVHAALLLAPLPALRGSAEVNPGPSPAMEPIQVTWADAVPGTKKPPVAAVTVRVLSEAAAAPAAVSTNHALPPAPVSPAAKVEANHGSLSGSTGESQETSPGGVAASGSAAMASPTGGSTADGTGETGIGTAPWYTPEPVYAPKPEYPLLARQQGWEGEVLLEAIILPDGRIERITILSPSGHPVLDNAARKAVAQWVYPPLPPAETGSRRLTVHLTFRLPETP